MKELLKQYAAYNNWANQRVNEVVLRLSPEQQQQQISSSFSSIHKTLLHCWDAESIWWQRMKLHERLIIPSENFNGSTTDVINGLTQQDKLWEDWVNNASDMALEHVFQYYNSKKEMFKQPIYQMLIHVFNHSTYHRGQLITLLRQVGIDKPPATDFIIFSRKK